MDTSSDLEFMVQTDMIEHGYNPYDIEEIYLYWEMMINGN